MTFRVNLFPESRHWWKVATGSKCPRLSAVLVNVFPVVRTGVPPLQGRTLTGSNAGSCDREAAFCSKRSGNAEFICLRLLFPERDKDEGFFCCSDRKTNSGCPIFTAPEQILSSCRKTPGRSPTHCHVEHSNEREEPISWTHLQSF